MKRILSLAAMAMMVLGMSAQMNVWKNGQYTQYFFNEVDSITFGVVTPEILSIEPTSATMYIGSTLALEVTAIPVGSRVFVWESSNEQVATVNDEGVVSALNAGTADITVRTGEKVATCAITVLDPLVDNASLQGTDYYIIQLGEQEMYQVLGNTIAYFGQNTADQSGSKNLYVWDGTYVAGATQGKNFYGVTGEGWVSMTVTNVGWSGLGYSCGWGGANPTPAGKEAEQQEAMADLNKLAAIMDAPDDYYFHIAMKSTDNASHLLILNGANNTVGRVCIGAAAFNDNGATYPAYADFKRNGDWGEIEIPMSYFTKQGLVYGANNTAGINVLSILSGGVSGTQLQFDACFIYKKAK